MRGPEACVNELLAVLGSIDNQMTSKIEGISVSELNVLRVDWLVGDDGPLIAAPGRVALSSCPGRTDVGGDVKSDINHLLSLRIGLVVSLVSDIEMEYYGVSGLRQALRSAKLAQVEFPIDDMQPPRDIAATQSLCHWLLGHLQQGTNILIHCIGGWGRSGTIAASLLTHQGYSADAAIALVRKARSPRCVEARAQERFVHEYARSEFLQSPSAPARGKAL